MLTSDQINEVWKRRISAEIYSLYFGDFANRYTRQKQWITGVSFFLSSGAAAVLIAKMPIVVPIILSILVAVMTAYAVALNLDSKVRTMAELHYAWCRIESDYKRLWNHAYDDNAETELEALQCREAEVSQTATTDAPNDQKRMERWEDLVLKSYGLTNA